jgi:predicted XRE-type DNA-binding protein
VVEESAMIESERFESVWDAIEDTPEEAAKMKAISDLMSQVIRIVEENRWSATEAATRFHVSSARMEDLQLGRIYLFSFEDLLAMVGALGRKVRIEIEAA